MGCPDEIELPKPGERLHVNAPAWRMSRRDATVRVLAPVNGEVVETGPSEEIFSRPRTDYTKALIAAAFKAETAPEGVVAQ